jgi:hypothetical protein
MNNRHKAMSNARIQTAEVELKAQIAALLKNASTTDEAVKDEPDLDIPAEIERRQARLAAIAAAWDRTGQSLQAKPLLQTVNAQHHGQLERRASRLGHRRVRRNQDQQLTPRHDQLHFVEQDLFTRALGVQIKAKAISFHAVIKCELRASVAYLAE